MANANVNMIGAVNQAGDRTALMLKVFTGEVLVEFEKRASVLDKHFVRTISNGKSAQFPVMGDMPDAEYHVPGTEITGQTQNNGERTITIDQLLISHAFVADIDEAMLHYEVRSRLAQKMGSKLAMAFDQNVYREGLLIARANSVVTGGPGGKVITDAKLDIASIDGSTVTKEMVFDAWVDAIYGIRENFDNKDVTGPMYLGLKPAVYYWLLRQMNANGFSLLENSIGGKGSIAEGTMPRIAGIDLVATPHLPFADGSGLSYHAVNAANTVGFAWTPDAMGTVKLLDLSLQSAWDIRRQGTMMVARYAMGHGGLRPECACELTIA